MKYSINAYERCYEDGNVYYDVFVAETFEEADDIVLDCIEELADMGAIYRIERLDGNPWVDEVAWKITLNFADTTWKRIIVAPMHGNHSVVALEGDVYDEMD